LQDPILTAVNSEEDLEMARAVLANRQPEEVAAALVRIYRSRLPAAEDVFDPGPGQNRNAATEFRNEFREAKPLRRKDAPDGATQQYTWFRMDIGRKNNADPKWLLPMICRRGHVTKPDIGAIRINENETRFEIANHIADKFAGAAAQADKDDVAITRVDGAAAPAPKSERKRSFDRGMAKEGKPRYEDKAPHNEGDKPRFEGKKSFSDKPKFKDKAKFKPKEGGFKVKKAPWDKKK
jgi:ATP-dependent RNA helicase DeaD